MKTLLILAALTVVVACDRKPADAPATNAATKSSSAKSETAGTAAQVASATPEIAVSGEFGSNAALPVREGDPKPVTIPDEVVDELNLVAADRVTSAFTMRRLPEGSTPTVRLGGDGPHDGLLVTIEVSGREKSRRVPAATNVPELVSNLDHTVDRLLDGLGIGRARPGN